MNKAIILTAFVLILLLQTSFALKLAVYGDSRDPYDLLFSEPNPKDIHQKTAAQIALANPDIIVSTGDIIKGWPGRHEQIRKFCSVADGIAEQTEAGFHIAVGNHDNDARIGGIFEDMASECSDKIVFPEKSDLAIGAKGWKHFEYLDKDAHFFFLNSEESLKPGSPQFNWLSGRLKWANYAYPGKFKFVVLHKPALSIGTKSRALKEAEQKALQALFSEQQVSVVFAGNDHAFSWCAQNKVLYLVTGGGGAELKDVGQPNSGTDCIAAEKIYHWLLLETLPNGTAEVKALSHEGSVLYTISGITPNGYFGSCSTEAIEAQCNRLQREQCDYFVKACKKLEEAQTEETKLRKVQVGSGDRSEKIRTYNFPQGRVTDHRINLTLHSLDKILDGEIDEIIDGLAAAEKMARLKGK